MGQTHSGQSPDGRWPPGLLERLKNAKSGPIKGAETRRKVEEQGHAPRPSGGERTSPSLQTVAEVAPVSVFIDQRAGMAYTTVCACESACPELHPAHPGHTHVGSKDVLFTMVFTTPGLCLSLRPQEAEESGSLKGRRERGGREGSETMAGGGVQREGLRLAARAAPAPMVASPEAGHPPGAQGTVVLQEPRQRMLPRLPSAGPRGR